MPTQLGGLVANRIQRWPDTYTEDESTLRQDIESCCLLGEQNRVAQWENDDRCDEPYPLGPGRDEGQRLHGFVEIAVVTWSFGTLHSRSDPEPVEHEVVVDCYRIEAEFFGGFCYP